jgi:hypothetical protein
MLRNTENITKILLKLCRIMEICCNLIKTVPCTCLNLLTQVRQTRAKKFRINENGALKATLAESDPACCSPHKEILSLFHWKVGL